MKGSDTGYSAQAVLGDSHRVARIDGQWILLPEPPEKRIGLNGLPPMGHADTEKRMQKAAKPAGRARFHGPCGQAWISSLISTLVHRDFATGASPWITHPLRGHPWPLRGELPTEPLNHQFFQLRGLTSDAS